MVMTTKDNDHSLASSESTKFVEDGVGNSKKENLNIAKNEDMAVAGLRLILLAVLIIAAVVVSLMVYFYTSGKQQEEFEAQFNSDAQKIFESIGTNFDRTLGAADAFIYKFVSHVHFAGSTWPYVTFPDFAVQASKLLSLSYAVWCGMFIHVTKEQRYKWQKFTTLNDEWVKESIQVQKRNPNYYGPITEEFNVFGEIYNNSNIAIPYDHPGPYMPSWYASPVVPESSPPYNWDALNSGNEEYGSNLMYAMKTQTPVVTAVFNYVEDPDDAEEVANVEAWAQWVARYISPDDDPVGPMSELMYPIFDNIENVESARGLNMDGENYGVISFSFYWRDTIKNLLPDNSRGIIVVFANACDNVFTYRIDGADVTWIGGADYHDPKFDYLGQSSLLTDTMGKDISYTGLPLNKDLCPMTLSVYPSQDMEDNYITSDPGILAGVAALIFVFTSALFLLYDWFVARRQKLIKNRALASGAIVNNLFPERIVKQLYAETQSINDSPNKKDTNSFLAAAKSADSVPVKGKPIAELFDETSVFFADLAGFTAWSSVRTPTEVFELLETLYGAFDQIAQRRNVFKIETIGDCYVAVTGIPEPQQDHAVIMVKFARDCIAVMNEAIIGLSNSMGADVKELKMRVGIHSGSTTAGVLRGEKGRFQLFGDTVNTASRMETNGIPGRIHVSEVTAEKLREAGKGNWLIAREDKVLAKGKGMLQTYFVSFDNHSASVASKRLGETSKKPVF